MDPTDDDALLESLAAAEHEGWSRWMKHLLDACVANQAGSLTIPPHLAAEWQRQLETDYSDLSDQEKEADRAEVRRILPLIRSAIRRSGRSDIGPI